MSLFCSGPVVNNTGPEQLVLSSEFVFGKFLEISRRSA